jgi:putative ABC transport system substrate-binding protein
VRAQAFEAGLRELGWVDGRNLRLDYRWVPNADRLRAQAGELVGLAPDLVVAVGTPVVAGLLPLSRSLPIVFVGVTDPVGSGFVKNLARPGGHVTGFTLFEFSIGSKWLEALKEIAPNVKRVAVVFSPDARPARSRAARERATKPCFFAPRTRTEFGFPAGAAFSQNFNI